MQEEELKRAIERAELAENKLKGIEEELQVIITTIIISIIITRPKPAYGQQGLAGSWGQDTDEVSTFLVFLTSHFAPVALSSDLNQPWTIDDNKNPLEIMKTDLDP